MYLPTVAFAPAVVVAPAVEGAPVMVPEAYTWDGFEYVGLVGGQCFYLGPGNVWLAAGPDRLERFHGWERGHTDWQHHKVLDFDVNPGEICVIMGPSGCGKSVLLKQLVGLEEPDQGVVLIAGQSIQAPDLTTRHRLAMLRRRPINAAMALLSLTISYSHLSYIA